MVREMHLEDARNRKFLPVFLIEPEALRRHVLLRGKQRRVVGAVVDRYHKTVPRIKELLAELLLLTRTRPLEPAKLAMLKSQVEQKLTVFSTTMDVRRNEGFTAAQSLFSNNLGKDTMDSIHVSIGDIRAIEMRSMADREVALKALGNHTANNSYVACEWNWTNGRMCGLSAI